MPQETIFTKIINREIPAMIAYEDDDVIAFADINPRADGHLLVAPKTVYRWFLDIPPSEFSTLMTRSQNIAQQLKQATDADYIQLGIVGDEVPHVHVHLIPRRQNDDPLNSPGEFDEAKTKQIIDQFN